MPAKLPSAYDPRGLYEDHDRYLGYKTERPFGNNTRLYRGVDHTICVIYHSTTIVRYYPDGRIMARTGGWHTVTTWKRINQALSPLGVSIHRSRRKGHGYTVYGPGYTADYYESITFRKDGTLDEGDDVR